MEWNSTLITLYLLGFLSTAALLAKPIRRVMSDNGVHADIDSARDAEFITVFFVIGVAALWALTLPTYLVLRFIPASAGDPGAETHGVELALADHSTHTD